MSKYCFIITKYVLKNYCLLGIIQLINKKNYNNKLLPCSLITIFISLAIINISHANTVAPLRANSTYKLAKQALLFAFADLPITFTHYFCHKTNKLVIDVFKATDMQAIEVSQAEEHQLTQLIDLSKHDWQDITQEYLIHFDNPKIPIKCGLLRQKTKNCLRIICTLEANAEYKLFFTSATSFLPPYLILETAKKNYFTIDNDRYSLQLRDIIIAVDAGHGGYDPGSIGAGGKCVEKDINLKVAKELVGLLNQVNGFQAVMTRKADEFIKLEQRIKIAQDNRADFFISLHADGSKNTRACGCSVFVLSPKTATKEKKFLDKDIDYKINLFGITDWLNLDKYKWREQITNNLLLSQSTSNKVAENILSQLAKISSLHQDRVHHESFVVLKSLNIPSVLVELGFITNPTEIDKLTNTKYQQQLAQAILTGIVEWFCANPPEHTLVFENSRDNFNTI